ncbi:hypothetical protein OKW28_008554 [Paraburkholderia sp. 40]
MDGTVWDHSTFSKNRDRLLEHDVLVLLLNETVETARERGHLSGEHFSVDGTLIQAWAGHKSFVPKASPDEDDTPPDEPPAPNDNWHGQKRSNATHQSTTDEQARLFRKSKGTGAMLCYMGHVLTDNRHGLAVNAQVRWRRAPPSATAPRKCLLTPRRWPGAALRSGQTRTTTRAALSPPVGQIASRLMWRKMMGVQGAQRLTSEPVGRVTRSASKNISGLSRCSDGARQSDEFDRRCIEEGGPCPEPKPTT